MQIQLVVGDDNVVEVLLRRNGRAVFVAPTAVVRASVVNEKAGIAVGPVTADVAAVGPSGAANWAGGLIILEWPSALSDTLPTGEAYIEIEVNDGRKQTYFLRNVCVEPQKVE